MQTAAKTAASQLVLQAFDAARRGGEEVQQLAAIWDTCSQARTLREQLDSFVALRNWIRVVDEHPPLPEGDDRAEVNQYPPLFRRHHVVLRLQELSPELNATLNDVVAGILSETSGLALFAETGLSSDRGLTAEFFERFWRRILPTPREDSDLSKLLVHLFPTHAEAERFASMPPEIFQRLVNAHAPPERSAHWQPVAQSLWEAFRLLGVRIQALGLSQKLRARSNPSPLLGSPFFELDRTSETLELCAHKEQNLTVPLEQWRKALGLVRGEMKVIVQKLEETGVNLDVVYSLDVIGQGLDRMEAIAAVLATPRGPARNQAVCRLAGLVIHDRLNDRSLLQLMRTNLRLLATRIIDHASKTGEHYIAVGRREYWAMWKAAAGGGLLTAGTAAIKLVVAHTTLPPFVIGVLAGLNYAVSFVLIQSCHFVLATKQPSMTAATCAGIIRSTRGESRWNELARHVAQIFRSQTAAAFGNILAVAAAAALFDVLWKASTGRPYLTIEEAEHLVHSLSPWASGTMFYAALTGVILWFSGLVGGWLDNWAVYRKLPQALAEHPTLEWLGHGHLRRIVNLLPNNVAAWGGSVALGFMLGMTPVMGQFLGIPLDVRHVTLTTGTVAFAAESLGRDYFYRGWMIESLAGIAVIFVLNLTVSFAIALMLAMRAYDLPARDHLHLLNLCFRHFLRSPLEFFYPPKQETGVAKH
jgi:site-specific recombinase